MKKDFDMIVLYSPADSDDEKKAKIQEAHRRSFNSLLSELGPEGLRKLCDMPSHEEARLSNMNQPGDNVPDEEFYQVIVEDPSYLGARFAQEKMAAWRNDLVSEDKKTRERAQYNLKRIGTELAKLPDQEADLTEWRAVATYQSVLQYLQENKKTFTGLRNKVTLAQRIREHFHIDFTENDCPPSSSRAPALAENITAKICKLTPGTVNQYRKRIQVDGYFLARKK